MEGRTVRSCWRRIKISCCIKCSTFSFCNSPKYFPRGTHWLVRGFSIHVTVQKHNCLMIWYYSSILKSFVGRAEFWGITRRLLSSHDRVLPPLCDHPPSSYARLAPVKGWVYAALPLCLFLLCTSFLSASAGMYFKYLTLPLNIIYKSRPKHFNKYEFLYC